jgi:23S rRNA (adenine2503-C2)-methyltransferase
MSALYGVLPSELDQLVASLGEPGYRAGQLLHAAWRDLARGWDEVTTLPVALKQHLSRSLDFSDVHELTALASADGSTTKLLLRMDRATLIETVLMQYPRPGRHPRSTVCVSTQAGCAMGCVFCATGQMGFERNLSAAEITAQVVHVQRRLRARGEHVTNVVFMGMGEPLANYAETVRAVRLLTDPRAFGLAQRAITISTVGVIRGIDRLASEDLQVGLAISLHAGDNVLRRELVPTASPHSFDDLVAAANRYFDATGRRVTFEYALLKGVNDREADASRLAAALRGRNCHVNLIPVNPTAGGFERPSRGCVLAFERILRAAGIPATVRVEKGVEIAAACGQLRTDRATPGATPDSPPGR